MKNNYVIFHLTSLILVRQLVDNNYEIRLEIRHHYDWNKSFMLDFVELISSCLCGLLDFGCPIPMSQHALFSCILPFFC